ncbi:MAG: hypothetical protein ACOY94_13235 [Bacillota bacterium]
MVGFHGKAYERRAASDGGQVKKAQVEPDRDPPGARVNISGLTTSNSSGTMLLDALVRKLGLSVDEYVLEYGYNQEKKQIALYPAHPKTVGAVKVRRLLPVRRHGQSRFARLRREIRKVWR